MRDDQTVAGTYLHSRQGKSTGTTSFVGCLEPFEPGSWSRIFRIKKCAKHEFIYEYIQKSRRYICGRAYGRNGFPLVHDDRELNYVEPLSRITERKTADPPERSKTGLPYPRNIVSILTMILLKLVASSDDETNGNSRLPMSHRRSAGGRSWSILCSGACKRLHMWSSIGMPNTREE